MARARAEAIAQPVVPPDRRGRTADPRRPDARGSPAAARRQRIMCLPRRDSRITPSHARREIRCVKRWRAPSQPGNDRLTPTKSLSDNY